MEIRVDISQGYQLKITFHDPILSQDITSLSGLTWFLLHFRVADFEFTPECIVFDLLSIGLYHGWLIDPQNAETVSAVGGLSYNQLVEKIIASKQDGAESQLVSEGIHFYLHFWLCYIYIWYLLIIIMSHIDLSNFL